MKKLLLFSTVCLCSMGAFSQVASDTLKIQTMLEQEKDFEKIAPYFEGKIFHDRQIMTDAIKWIYSFQQMDIDTLNKGRVKSTQSVFNEKDSNILEKNMEVKRIHYDLSEDELNELLKKADEDPSAAFKSFLMSATIPKLTSQELSEMNTVDRKALSKRLEMVTESGPDIGANQVPVMYFE